MARKLWLLSLVAILGWISSGAAAVTPRETTKAQTAKPADASLWTAGATYGVSTDLADQVQPRLYYQGINAFVGRKLTSALSASLGLSGTFTTIDGQIDKLQEDSRLEASGVSPSFGLNYNAAEWNPWFLSAFGSALMDTASRREGYVGLVGGNFGGTWKFFGDRFSMTHTLGVSELMNTYEFSSDGTPNPGTSVNYAWNNALSLGEHFSLTAGFGIKRTRYLDGSWDYTYSTSLGAAFVMKQWNISLSTTNGGYTDDGRIALWYIDQYRRVVSLALAYNF